MRAELGECTMNGESNSGVFFPPALLGCSPWTLRFLFFFFVWAGPALWLSRFFDIFIAFDFLDRSCLRWQSVGNYPGLLRQSACFSRCLELVKKLFALACIGSSRSSTCVGRRQTAPHLCPTPQISRRVSAEMRMLAALPGESSSAVHRCWCQRLVDLGDDCLARHRNCIWPPVFLQLKHKVSGWIWRIVAQCIELCTFRRPKIYGP